MFGPSGLSRQNGGESYLSSTNLNAIFKSDNHIKGTPEHTVRRILMVCLGKSSNPTQEVPYESMRALYAENDLQSNNNLVGIVDEQGKRIFKKRLPIDPHCCLN